MRFTNCLVSATGKDSLALRGQDCYITTHHCLIDGKTSGHLDGHETCKQTAAGLNDQLKPHESSEAVNAAQRLFEPFLPYDREGHIRDTHPDIGCFERS